jgi:hypothetical protein
MDSPDDLSAPEEWYENGFWSVLRAGDGIVSVVF